MSLAESLVFACLGVVGAFMLPQTWMGKGEDVADQGIQMVWPYSDKARRAFTRLFPLSSTLMITLGFMGVTHYHAIVDAHGAFVRWFDLVLIPATLIQILLIPAVILLNRPKWIVA